MRLLVSRQNIHAFSRRRKVCVCSSDRIEWHVSLVQKHLVKHVYTDTRGASAIDLQIRTHFRPVPIHSRDLRFV